MRIHLNRQKGIEIRLLGKLSTYIKCEILGALVHFNTTLKIDEWKKMGLDVLQSFFFYFSSIVYLKKNFL